MLRAFVGLRLPDSVAQEIDVWAAALRARWPASVVRWVPASHMHLTLRFLGDSEAAALAALERVLAELGTRCAPFALRLAGLGAFPNERKPRVLWVGLDGDMAALQLLQRQIEEAVQGLGWQAEQRAFRPHLTLGRVRAHQELSMSAGGDAPPDLSFAVAEVELIESRLHKRGPQYHTLYRAALMG